MVEYVRFVVIEGTKTAVGPAAGAAVGGIAGRSVGDGAVRDIATVAGGVAGGIAGAATEEAVTRRQGVEVTVRLDNGKIIAVVQEVAANVRFSPGDRVRVLTLGNTTRVIQ
jgi:outer membrane lipoprotein SlyB